MKTRKAYRGEDGIWRLPLTRGYETLLDEDDALWAEQWLWTVQTGPKSRTAYARRSLHEGHKTVGKTYLHREVASLCGVDCSGLVDHVNGNGLDNRRNNLRAASFVDSSCNVGLKANNKSGFKGVSYIRRTGKYRAEAQRGGVKLSSNHDTPEEAATAAAVYRIELHAQFRRDS